MARKQTIKSIDVKISRNKIELSKVKARYNQLANDLKRLQNERQALESEAIMTAYRKSKKSFDELMTFLRG